MRRVLFSFLVSVLIIGAVGSNAQRPVTIGIVVDGPWDENATIRQLFISEIEEILAGEFTPTFTATRTGSWTIESVRAATDELLADRSVDLVLTLGPLATHDVCQRGALPKPVIAPVAIDADLQGLPRKNGASGVDNLNYTVFPNNIVADLKTFREIVSFDRVTLLINKKIRDAIPNIDREFERIVAEMPVTPTVFSVGDSVDEALNAIPDDCQAVYLGPLIHLPAADFDKLVAELNRRKLPTFSLLGRLEVERGVLAGASNDIFPRLARRVAINVQRILLGENASTLPTVFAAEKGLLINMSTARLINVYPNWGVITEAELLNDRARNIDRVLTMEQAVDEALAANLDLAARELEVVAGRQDVAAARANLLPNVDLSLLGVQIDKDRAEGSLGQQAERELSGSATFRQVIFSEPAMANLTINRHLQNNREFLRDALAFDIAELAARGYLNVLRANAVERIQQENLKRTRSNLDLARVRASIGTARSAEILRWESEVANNRIRVIDANAQRNVAEIALNQLLNRPSEEPFRAQEETLANPSLLFTQDRIAQYMNNPWDFRTLRGFMVAYGLRETPEIKALSEAIAAQRRGLDSSGRSFWLPELGLEAGVTNVFARDGAGSDIDTSQFPFSLIGEPKDLSWQVGVSATYSLFEGGAKIAARRQAATELLQLRTELDSVRQKVEQRVRSAFHQAGASYAGIQQSRIAADAARQSLDLVEDAYSSGAATILDLLDAQNNALVADEVAANAVYDFLVDLIAAQRAAGLMVIQMDETERSSFFQELDAFFASSQNNN